MATKKTTTTKKTVKQKAEKLYALIGDYDLMTKEEALKQASNYWDGDVVLVKAENVIRPKTAKSIVNLPVIEV